MADIIKMLPDSISNQIAAGEVIQRPSSVVKELIENSVDSESSVIKVIVRESGKNLIQVIDNGSGMSETDARLSFERHATSKINNAEDLFAIQTLGFRGEALASIAAISEIEMQTKKHDSDLGSLLEIKGAKFIRQETVACKAGCNISVKNLFFNVPARRKFLKTNSTELKHIITEFHRVALAHSGIEFSLWHDGNEIFHLVPANHRQRLMHVFGKNINQHLIEVKTHTNLAKINGFIAKPGYAKKTPGEQFFFLNKRFMKHPYFHKAITQAFDKILPSNVIPSYFIYFIVDPKSVDVNIHPTKTEIKFENDNAIWQILMASIKEALGKFNIVPSIDFNTAGMIDMPLPGRKSDPASPEIHVNPNYNPFHKEKVVSSSGQWQGPTKNRFGSWQELYKGFQSDSGYQKEKHPERTEPEQEKLPDYSDNEKPDMLSFPSLFQVKNKYILSPVKSGLMIIDQRRAHERILYEKFMKTIQTGSVIAQQQLYPVSIELDPSDYLLIKELSKELADFGFDIRDFGPNTVLVSGCPADTIHADPEAIIENLIAEYKTSGSVLHESIKEKVSRNLARSSAIDYGKTLSREEMQELIDKLFACEMPNYSPDGKPVVSIISSDEIEKKFKNP